MTLKTLMRASRAYWAGLGHRRPQQRKASVGLAIDTTPGVNTAFICARKARSSRVGMGVDSTP
eukprot:8945503-Alexandrium_andersonii.AAC.1